MVWFEESLVPERVDDDLRCGREPSEDKAPDEQRVVDVQDWERGRKSGIIENDEEMIGMICDWLTG